MKLRNGTIAGAAMIAMLLPMTTSGHAGQYLVSASGGSLGARTPQQAVTLLANKILPSFAAFEKLKAEGKILAGGLPVGERAFVFIVEAPSNEAVDKMIRDLSIWHMLKWKVTPLQSFANRGKMERRAYEMLKKKTK